MSEHLVHIKGAPRPRTSTSEIMRIALNLASVCALGGVVLGGVYMATARYQAAARLDAEKRAVVSMLDLGAEARVTEVRQYLDAAQGRVVYRARPYGDATAAARELAFSLDGVALGVREIAGEVVPKSLQPLGRLFVARQGAALAGFVLEGDTRGYKNRIRFFVALDSSFTIAGVRVLEHEEDPGLGAEVAEVWFTGQFLGRRASDVAALRVTRDPLPEDWRGALGELAHTHAPAWRSAHAALLERERSQSLHAVTGATISSRALTDGVRGTIEHFRRRWALLAPALGEGS